jgi:hypothetical protein
MRLEKMIPVERDLPRRSLRKAHLVGELATWSSNARRRRRHRVLVLVPAVLAFLAVTGFTTYALTREPTHLESIACYDRASLDADVAVVGSDERHPLDICGEVWRMGAFGQEGESPLLAACVLQTGAIGVFPKSGGVMCAELGLADLPPSFRMRPRDSPACKPPSSPRLESLHRVPREEDPSASARMTPT